MSVAELQEKIRRGENFEALTLIMNAAVELKIATMVADSDLDSPTNKWQSEDCLHTRLNLISLEIENKIGSKSIDNPAYSQIEQLHLEQVWQGREILIKNLESWQAIFRVLASKSCKLRASEVERVRNSKFKTNKLKERC